MLGTEMSLSWRIGKFVFFCYWEIVPLWNLDFFFKRTRRTKNINFAFGQKCIWVYFYLGVLWVSSGAAGFYWVMQKEVWETIMFTPVLFIEDYGTMKDGKYRGKFCLSWVCLTDPDHFHLESKLPLHLSLCWTYTMLWPMKKIPRSRNTQWGHPWQERAEEQERDTQPLPMGILVAYSYLERLPWPPRALL